MNNNKKICLFLDKSETLCVAAHERLGEVLRILKSILEKYSPIQHNELLAAASNLISHVNGMFFYTIASEYYLLDRKK